MKVALSWRKKRKKTTNEMWNLDFIFDVDFVAMLSLEALATMFVVKSDSRRIWFRWINIEKNWFEKKTNFKNENESIKFSWCWMRAMMKIITSSNVKKAKPKASSSRCNVVKASFLSEESINAKALFSRKKSTNVKTSFSSEKFANDKITFWEKRWTCVWTSILNKWKTIVKY